MMLILFYKKKLQNDWGGDGFYKNMRRGDSEKNGVITLAFLKKYNVYFDFQHNKMVLYDRKKIPKISQPAHSWRTIPFNTGNGVNTTLKVDNNKLHIIWDTALMPSMLSNKVINENNLYDCKPLFSNFTQNPKCYSLNTTQLNNTFLVWDINLPPQAKIDGFIGSDYFYQHKVFIDFSNDVLHTT